MNIAILAPVNEVFAVVVGPFVGYDSSRWIGRRAYDRGEIGMVPAIISARRPALEPELVKVKIGADIHCVFGTIFGKDESGHVYAVAEGLRRKAKRTVAVVLNKIVMLPVIAACL
jgi:hypothetical protein